MSQLRWFLYDLVTGACEVIAASVLFAILACVIYGWVSLVSLVSP